MVKDHECDHGGDDHDCDHDQAVLQHLDLTLPLLLAGLHRLVGVGHVPLRVAVLAPNLGDDGTLVLRLAVVDHVLHVDEVHVLGVGDNTMGQKGLKCNM